MTDGRPEKKARLAVVCDCSTALSPQVRENLLWAGITVAILCLYLFAFGDKPAALFFRSPGPALSDIHQEAHKITGFGNSAWYLIPSAVFFLALRWLRSRTGDPLRREKIAKLASLCLFLFVAVAFSGILTDLLKAFFGRTRPSLLAHGGFYSFSFFAFSAKMWSFPSGHANTIFALATACFLVAPRGWFFYFPIAVLVAASRVVVGAHYPSDVLMGAYLGVLTTLYLKQFFLRRGVEIFPGDRR